MSFEERYGLLVSQVNEALDKYITERDVPEGSIYKSMKYSLMAGGKRLRPVLVLAVCQLMGGVSQEVMPFACALEMIHTYSLIHDDLPAMDNDDYRRGRLTNHKVFGEGKAILAGDALLNYAYEIMTEDILKCRGTDTRANEDLYKKVEAMDIISKASGVSGMIGGQVVDLESEGKEISHGLLCYMHRLKTGALIKASILSSAVLCGACGKDLSILGEFGDGIGIAFQIRDDILDVEGSFEDMGKAAGRDAVNRKGTFISAWGLEGSKRKLRETAAKACILLDRFGERGDFLKELGNYIAGRKN